MSLALGKPKTTVFTVFFWPLVAKITVFTVCFASYRAKTLVFTQFSTCCKRLLRVGGNAKTLYSTMFFLLWHRKKLNLPIRLHAAKSVDLGGIKYKIATDIKTHTKGCKSKAYCESEARKSVCKEASGEKCESSCCEGDLCNASLVPAVSVLLMVSCALVVLF